MSATMSAPSPIAPHLSARPRLRPSLGPRMLLLVGLALAVGVAAPATSRAGAGAREGGTDEQAERLPPDPDWRPRGLAHIDLPLQLRARFDAADGRWDSRAARLASPYTSQVGPGIAAERAIESRIALTRPIVGRLELEISWRTRNRLSGRDPMGFGPQVVGALLRFTP